MCFTRIDSSLRCQNDNFPGLLKFMMLLQYTKIRKNGLKYPCCLLKHTYSSSNLQSEVALTEAMTLREQP